MFLTTHAAAGIFIAHAVPHPGLVFGLAVASHFVLDFIPHGDEHLYRDDEWKRQKKYCRVVYLNAIDIGLLSALTIWAYHYTPQAETGLMMLGVLGSVIPDFLSYFFPIIHERLSWLWLVRWFYRATKPTGLRYLIRAQNWLHQALHHQIIQRDIPFRFGLALQVVIAVTLLAFSR